MQSPPQIQLNPEPSKLVVNESEAVKKESAKSPPKVVENAAESTAVGKFVPLPSVAPTNGLFRKKMEKLQAPISLAKPVVKGFSFSLGQKAKPKVEVKAPELKDDIDPLDLFMETIAPEAIS